MISLKSPVAIMPPPTGRTPLVDEFQSLIDSAEGKPIQITEMDRFAFYERARNAYAIIATGERRLYGNIILVKGVVRPEE